MLRHDFTSFAEVPGDNLTLTVPSAGDEISFNYGSYANSQKTLGHPNYAGANLEPGARDPLGLVTLRRPQPLDTKAQQGILRYQALISISTAIDIHHRGDDLLFALATELLRVVELDFVSLSRYNHETCKVDWLLCRPSGAVERDVIDATDDQTLSAWLGEHRKPVIVSSLNPEAAFGRKIRELAREGTQSLYAFPLIGVDGCFVVGSKQPAAYSQEEIHFLSLVANMISPAVNNITGTVRHTRDYLRGEKNRLHPLLDLISQIASSPELRESLRIASGTIRSMMQCDAASIHLHDEQSSSIRLFAEDSHESTEAEKGRLDRTSTADEIRRAFGSCQPILSGEGSRCALPIIGRSRVLGVLELNRREALLQEDVASASQIANFVAIAIENALACVEIKELKEQFAREKLYLEDEIRSERGFEEIIGRSSAIRSVLREIEIVAGTDSTVLICGETGTGKELVARAIHERSARCSNAFVKLNCAAIPTGLLESELFGHEKGAFTGAITQRIGRFELANRGTAFLDEIGEISLELQPKLLRVLQEREFERLGSTRTIKTDARLIAATNRNLGACVDEKTFRADLFYRLNVFPIHVPPLRERADDIPLLVRHFVQHFSRRMNRAIDTIPSETMEALVRYSWPGNIRELQNLIEHSVILSPRPVLRVPLSALRSHTVHIQDGAGCKTLEEAEREHILATLNETKWVISGPRGAATRLGIKRSTLQFRMKKLGIARPRAE